MSGVWLTVLLAALIAFGLYRRVRRNVGRQRTTPKRFVLRVCTLSIVGMILLGSLLSSLEAWEVVEAFAGLAAGAVLGLLGIHLTEFGWDEGGAYHVPNAYLGLAVSALLIGRLAYRLVRAPIGAGFDPAAVASGRYPESAFRGTHDPVSGTLLFVFVGYYVVYYVGVLLRSEGEGGSTVS